MNGSSSAARAAFVAAAAVATLSRPSPVHSLAFDVSSRGSSSFAPPSLRDGAIRECPRRPSTIQMKVSSSGKQRTRTSKASRLIELNNDRIRTAGRPGTKKFMDPNKVFLGNLPYDAVEDDVHQMFADHWNVPLDSAGERIESVRIVRDWRTGKSKGYGFVQFYDPMTATSAMESVNKGRGGTNKIKGRRIRLDQGKRKEGENEEEARMKRKKKKKKEKEKAMLEQLEAGGLDEEGEVILSALEDAGEGVGMSEDDMIAFMEKGGLRGVMPLTEENAGFLGVEGLYDDKDGPDDGYFEEYYNENGYGEGDFGDLEEEEVGEGEGEIVYDGVFEEMYDPKKYEPLAEGQETEDRKKMNREQRRVADKKRKKRKLPFKGFGSGGD